MWAAESEISILKNEIKDVLKFKAIYRLFDKGYEIPMDGKSGLEIVHVRNDYRVNQIKKIKFIRWTNDNRKSLTIELTRKITAYNLEKQAYVEEESEFEIHSKVKIYNVQHIINKVMEELRHELVADKVAEELGLNN